MANCVLLYTSKSTPRRDAASATAAAVEVAARDARNDLEKAKRYVGHAHTRPSAHIKMRAMRVLVPARWRQERPSFLFSSFVLVPSS